MINIDRNKINNLILLVEFFSDSHTIDSSPDYFIEKINKYIGSDIPNINFESNKIFKWWMNRWSTNINELGKYANIINFIFGRYKFIIVNGDTKIKVRYISTAEYVSEFILAHNLDIEFIKSYYHIDNDGKLVDILSSGIHPIFADSIINKINSDKSYHKMQNYFKVIKHI